MSCEFCLFSYLSTLPYLVNRVGILFLYYVSCVEIHKSKSFFLRNICSQEFFIWLYIWNSSCVFVLRNHYAELQLPMEELKMRLQNKNVQAARDLVFTTIGQARG